MAEESQNQSLQIGGTVLCSNLMRNTVKFLVKDR